MVLESDPDGRRGFDHALREEDVLTARHQIAARVRVEQDDDRGAGKDRFLENRTGLDRRLRQGASVDFPAGEQPVAAVEEQCTEHLLVHIAVGGLAPFWWTPQPAREWSRRCTLGRIRRRFSEEFKREAVRLAREPGRTLAGVARDLKIGRKLLLAWRVKLDSEPIEGESPSQLRAELARLRRENERLREDQEILKKAVAIVSDRPR